MLPQLSRPHYAESMGSTSVTKIAKTPNFRPAPGRDAPGAFPVFAKLAGRTSNVITIL